MSKAGSAVRHREKHPQVRWSDRVATYHAGFVKFLSTFKDVLMVAGIIWGYLYAWGGNSHTTFHFADATGNALKLNVTAEGPKLRPAYLRDFRLSFYGLPIEDVRLHSTGDDITHTSMVINPGEPKVVALTVDGLRARCRESVQIGQPDRYTKEEIVSQDQTGYALLTVLVQESNDKDSPVHFVRRKLSLSVLQEFIETNLPGTIPEKTSC